MDLEPPNFDFVPSKDDRPHVPVPPPVTVVAVADVRMGFESGRGRAMDDFYIDLIGFEAAEDPDHPSYRADNVRVVFDVFDARVPRDHFRPLQLLVRDLEKIRLGLIERNIEFTSTHRLYTGDEMILTNDPSGNYLQIVEFRPIL